MAKYDFSRQPKILKCNAIYFIISYKFVLQGLFLGFTYFVRVDHLVMNGI